MPFSFVSKNEKHELILITVLCKILKIFEISLLYFVWLQREVNNKLFWNSTRAHAPDPTAPYLLHEFR